MYCKKKSDRPTFSAMLECGKIGPVHSLLCLRFADNSTMNAFFMRSDFYKQFGMRCVTSMPVHRFENVGV